MTDPPPPEPKRLTARLVLEVLGQVLHMLPRSTREWVTTQFIAALEEHGPFKGGWDPHRFRLSTRVAWTKYLAMIAAEEQERRERRTKQQGEPS
jgi:hypothetical protein